jgi:hypothetical protein
LHVSVDGYAARYSVGASNVISLDSRYNLSDWANVYATVYNNGVRVHDPTSPPMDQKLVWEAGASLPLYFDNPTYLGFASDMCSPDVGTNQILFVVSEEQEVSATFTELETGRVLASYSGYVPYAAAVAFEWDFTEWNGSPFTNDAYVVNFTAAGGPLGSPSTEMTITNKVDWDGVRKGASCFMTWQPEDPATQDGPWLNRMASEWIGGPVGSGNPGALRTLYQDLYNPWGLTQYYAWHVGGNRNNPECRPMQPGIDPWSTIIRRLARTNFSELTLGPAHGTGREIGRSPQGTSYITESFTPFDLRAQILAGGQGIKPDGSGGGGRNWRLRKAAFWTCYSGNVNLPSAGGLYETWPQACGIRPKNQQDTSWMMKNCGLFFGGEINQRGFAGGDGSISAAEVASTLDSVWVCGQNMYPGGCDPYYSFRFAVNATRGMYNPEMDKADPRIFGYYWCIYASTIDEMLTVGNTALVADPQ